MAPSIRQRLPVERRLGRDRKSAGAACLPLIFLGGFGAHRIDVGRTGSAVTILVLTPLAALWSAVGVGLVRLAAVAIWWILDLFLIPAMVRQDMDARRLRHRNEVAMLGGDRRPGRRKRLSRAPRPAPAPDAAGSPARRT